MSTITKKDLSIFRGTYLECKAQPTEDMKIYLAWDTHEIYVGNAYGEKTLYGVSKSLFERINLKFVELESFMDSKISEYVDEKFDELLDLRLADLKKDLELVISEKVKFHVDLKSMALQNEINNNSLSIAELKSSTNKHKQDFELNKENVKNEVNLLKQFIESNKSSITGLRNTTNTINNNLNKSLTKLQNDFNTAYRNLETSFTEQIKLEIGILTGANLDNFTTVSEIINDLKEDVFVDTQRLENLIDKRVLETDFNTFKRGNDDELEGISGKINTLDTSIKTEIANRISEISRVDGKIDSTKQELTGAIADAKADVISQMDKLIGTDVNGEGLFTVINNLDATHKSDIADLQNQINSKAKSEDLSAESARIDTLVSSLSETQTAVTTLNTQVSTIGSSLTGLATKLEVQNVSNTISGITTNLEAANQNITTNTNNISSLDERITSIENFGIDADINNKISALENADKGINSTISDINNKVGTLPEGEKDLVSFIQSKNELIETDIKKVNSRIDAIGNTISTTPDVIYLTADEMNEKDLNNYLDKNRRYILIFCIKNHERQPKRYKLGNLYYYGNNSITAISGGSGDITIEKDKFTAEVHDFVVSNWPTKTSYEISDIVYSNISISAKLKGDISDPNAVGSVSLTFDGSPKTVSINEIKDENDNLLYKGISSGTFSIDGSKSKEYKLSFSVTAAAEDTENYRIFEVKNGTHSKSVSFYKPSFIYLNDDEIYRGNGLPASKTYTTINAGDVLSFIVPSSKTYSKYWLTKTDYGYNDFTETTEETKTINNVKDVEYNVYKIRFAAGASNLLVGIQ